jgi:hypothetical protein
MKNNLSIKINDLSCQAKIRDLSDSKTRQIVGGASQSSSSSAFSYQDDNYNYDYKNNSGVVSESGFLPPNFSNFFF